MKPSDTNYYNLVLTIGFALAWAFFWAIDTTLAYVLFGGACFFAVLFFYNRLLVRDARFGTVRDEQKRESGTPTAMFPAGMRNIQLVWLAGWVLFAGVVIWVVYRTSEGSPYEMDEQVAFNEAERFYAATEYDSAYRYYKYAVTKNDEMAEAWLGLGNAFYMKSVYDSALLMYETAARINPDYQQAHYNIAWWYYDQKQHRESIAKLKKVVLENPSYLDAMQLTGDNFYELTEYDSALRWYEGAYTNGARSRWLCHVMAYLYDRENVLDKAIPLYKEALQYDSTVVEIYVRLGELLPGEEGSTYRQKANALKK